MGNQRTFVITAELVYGESENHGLVRNFAIRFSNRRASPASCFTLSLILRASNFALSYPCHVENLFGSLQNIASGMIMKSRAIGLTVVLDAEAPL